MNNCAISDKNYEHILSVWKAFEISTMYEYHDLYLKIDVLLLVCMFEIFRKESINSFELDPAHYLSTSGYSWDEMLRLTYVNVKLISDFEKYVFIEGTIRGRISLICKGYAKANNKYLKSCDANKPTSYIIYLVANNLYGCSMMHLLAIEILDWIEPTDFSPDNYSNNNPIECFSEVDLDYPDELHDLHNDYPFAGENVEVRKEMLSYYQLQIIDDNFFLGKNKKLIHNLENKKYKLHYQNLNFLNFSLQLKKNHRIIESKQEPLFKPYIKRNTDLQREAENEGNKIKMLN